MAVPGNPVQDREYVILNTMRFGLCLLLLSLLVPIAHADDLLPVSQEVGAPGTAPDAQGWWLVKDDKHRDIHCFARAEDYKEQRSFRVSATINGKPDDLAQVLLGFDGYANWLWSARESRLLKRVSATEYYLYVVYDSPYPLANRDSVLHARVKPQGHGDDRLILTVSAAPTYYPVQPGLVRMTTEDFTLVFTPLPGDRIEADLAGVMDLGTDVPTWAANFVRDEGPYYTMRGLQRLAQEPRNIGVRQQLPFPVYGYNELGKLADR